MKKSSEGKNAMGGNGGSKSPESSQARAEPIDAIQMLEAQHRAVEKVFTELALGSNGRDRMSALMEVADLLTAHAAIEERHFYPAIRTADTEALVDEAYDEHEQVKELLLHILDAGPDDADFSAKVEELQGMVEDHVTEEESDLFPRVREILGADQLEAIAQEMTATMVELEEEEPRERLIEDLGEEASPR